MNRRRLWVPLFAVAGALVGRSEQVSAPKVPRKTVAAPSLEYFGHSCVRIESGKGVKVLIDPYQGGGFPTYRFPEGQLDADLILVTHLHRDHDFGGNPDIQKRWGERVTTLYDGEAILDRVSPRVVVPVHYRILSLEEDVDAAPDTDWEPGGFGPVDPWLAPRSGVVRLDRNAIAFEGLKSLPDPATLVFQWPVDERGAERR
jgi:glyoxylase-like metal-dependent hydrolase (beta-lactamase superfamily II)